MLDKYGIGRPAGTQTRSGQFLKPELSIIQKVSLKWGASPQPSSIMITRLGDTIRGSFCHVQHVLAERSTREAGYYHFALAQPSEL
jgi:hypothetical protein